MQNRIAAALLGTALLACQALPVATLARVYPEARVSDHTDTYHGIEVRDPYRWLEDPQSEETQRWIAQQNELTHGFLAAIPERAALERRLTELWNFERYGVPEQRGGRLFFTRNDGLQAQSILYVVDSPSAKPRVLIDPNRLSDDGTIALASWVPSPDGSRIAYGLSDGGSDWRTWRVRDVATGADLPDVLRRNKFGGLDWAADSRSVFYERYERPTDGSELRALNTPAEICRHWLGTPEERDEVIVERPDTGHSLGFRLSERRDALIVSNYEAHSRTNELRYLPLDGAPARALIEGFDAQHRFVGDDGESLWVLTNEDAPHWQIRSATPLADGSFQWRELVPESPETIRNAAAVAGKLVVHYLKDATSRVRIFEADGRRFDEVAFPGLGTVYGFRGDPTSTASYYAFTSFARPTSIYRYDFATRTSTRFREPSVDFDPDDYATDQVFYSSADGTRVPMFLSYKKGLARDGNRPTYLYGYGGFNISLTPSFSVRNLAWLELGGVLAVPNLRGGGEYGEAWHEAGTKLQKQNGFDDFIAAAEWLIEERYTRPGRLAIAGGSNGGLLVGAVMTQRPALFGAALPAVGVMDMLRYHTFTIGWGWAGDYGTSDDPAEFAALYDYSPLHNLAAGTAYPATLVTTAERDDRVVPAHSFKFAAALQAAQAGSAPALIRIETRAGHGAGRSTAQRIEEAADQLSFVVHELEVGR